MDTVMPLVPTVAREQYGEVVEVWLTKKDLNVACMVVRDDESTIALDVESLSMRGAQRELTGYFLGCGYKPVGRWTAEEATQDSRTADAFGETYRTFKFAGTAS